MIPTRNIGKKIKLQYFDKDENRYIVEEYSFESLVAMHSKNKMWWHSKEGYEARYFFGLYPFYKDGCLHNTFLGQVTPVE